MFTRETPNVKREIERKFSVPTKIGQIVAVFGVWGSGVLKSFDFYSKRHVFANPRRLSHFASKSVDGCDLQVGWGEKTQKVTDAAIGKTCRR